MDASHFLLGPVAAMAVLVVGLLAGLKYFRAEIVELLRRATAPSDAALKRQSDELLAKMDRNVSERKARAKARVSQT